MSTAPVLDTQFMLILLMNLTTGGCSGQLLPASSLSEYILFSKEVLGGPMIIPVQPLNSMSSSFSRPQLLAPSPTPFCPASSSSNSLKLLGITAPPVEVAIFPLRFSPMYSALLPL